MIENLFNLKGKVALVTGGAKGLGAMITRGLVEAGVKVYISSRSADSCTAYAKEMAQYGECVALPADLTNMENISALAAKISENETQLDILINNSGATWGAPIGQFPEKGWDRVMDLNVKTIFFLTQEVLPLLKAASSPDNPARIINISSVFSYMANIMNTFSYGASKAAVNQLTRNLAHTLAPENILVNAIAPGFFPTKMTGHMDEKEQAAHIPLKRSGKPTDIAGLVIFLSSQAGSFMTGNVIPLDGGMLVK